MKLVFALPLIVVMSVPAAAATATEMLMTSLRGGDLKSAEALLSAGANPDMADRTGQTPLFFAMLLNRNDGVRLLLDWHADPNAPVNNRYTTAEFPLEYAARAGNIRMVSLLLQAGARINTPGQNGLTAFHRATLSGHLDMMQFLLAKGADPNTRDSEGASPLDDTCWRGSLDAAAILLAHGAHLDEPNSATGATPVNEAAFRGHTEMVRYLLRFHPDLSIPDRNSFRPLDNAVRMGREDCALLLLNAEPQSGRLIPALRKTMDAAVQKDEPRLVEALLKMGVAADGLLPSGLRPLEAAAAADAGSVAAILLQQGADPNSATGDGTSPLEEAALRGRDSIAGLLLAHGAQVNRINGESGSTALYAAASFGRAGVVKLLLDHAADPNLCGRSPKTPYAAALEHGFAALAAEIQRRGGTRNCKK